MNRILVILFILIGTVQAKINLDELIEKPVDSLPLYVIDKTIWDALTVEEQNELILAMGGGGGAVGAGNGGHSITCEGMEPVLLDYYEAMLPSLGGSSKKAVADYEMVEYFEKVFQFFPGFYDKYTNAKNKIGDRRNWIISDLKKSFDFNLGYKFDTGICKNPKLTQVALQQNGTVYVDQEEFDRLSPLQKGLLEIHETLYYLGIQYNEVTSSSIIREVMRPILQEDFLKDKIAIRPMILEDLRSSIQLLVGGSVQYSPFKLSRNDIHFLIRLFGEKFNIKKLRDRELVCISNYDDKKFYGTLVIQNFFELYLKMIDDSFETVIEDKARIYPHSDIITDAKFMDSQNTMVLYRMPSEQVFFSVKIKDTEGKTRDQFYSICN